MFGINILPVFCWFCLCGVLVVCFGCIGLWWALHVIAISSWCTSILNSVYFLVLVQDSVDYQGRSYLHIPQDIDVRLDTDEPPERCYLPKKHIHTWSVKAPSYYFPCYQKDMIIIVIIHSIFHRSWLASIPRG